MVLSLLIPMLNWGERERGSGLFFLPLGMQCTQRKERESESAVGLFLLDVLRNGLTLGFAYSWNFRREMR